jgi:hypothetical protein
VLRDWYDDRFVALECDGAIIANKWPSDFRDLLHCDTPPATLTVEGRRIDTIRRGAIVGFVD